MRSFLAVELAAVARHVAAGVARALRDGPGGDAVRWVRAENLHVTLRFLGDVAPERFADVAHQVGAALRGTSPFAVRLGPVYAFPSPKRPRVVALALAPADPVAELADAVEGGVVAAGFEPEARPFRAHLTLGRVRGRYALPAELDDLAARPEAGFEIHEVVLFASRLSPAGASYTPLERLPLGGSAHPENRPSGGT